MTEDPQIIRSEDAAEKIEQTNTRGTSPSNKGNLVLYRQKTEQINALKTTNQELSHMSEPHLRSWSELRRRRLLTPVSQPKVLQAFAYLSQKVMQEFQNAVVLVTSATPRGGTSLLALNLAIALSFHERNTSLLIDCHLKRSSRYRFLLKDAKTMGLSDYIRNPELSEQEIIYPVGISKVRVVPNGSLPLSGESFGSARMLELIVNTQHRYPERYVIIDAPPVSESAYVGLLADLSDCALLVVPYARSSVRDLEVASTLIGHSKLLGCVLNNIP